MKVTVRVHVNDAMNPLERKLSRSQVWQGLMSRAENPEPFVPGLLGYSILERAATQLTRELQFSALHIVERVTWYENESVEFETIGGDHPMRSHLDIRIEQPDAFQLILVFSFDTQLAEELSASGQDYRNVITDAYTENARETVLTIRKMFENQADKQFDTGNITEH